MEVDYFLLSFPLPLPPPSLLTFPPKEFPNHFTAAFSVSLGMGRRLFTVASVFYQ